MRGLLLKSYDSSYVANIAIRDEIPDSTVCSRYFSISENRIIKSLLNRKVQTGREISPCSPADKDSLENLSVHNERYKKLGKKRNYLLLLAEIMRNLAKFMGIEI